MAEQHFECLDRMLTNNAKWASDIEEKEPKYFADQFKGQAPPVLWIGCADSRVPESVVTGSKPGDLFVHRNIANQFHPDDENALSVLTYAVEHLNVEHVIVVGHTGCGGAAACFAASCSSSFQPGQPTAVVPSLSPDAPLNRWLTPLTNLAASLQLSTAPAEEALPILVEENVKAQVENLTKTDQIRHAWKHPNENGKTVYVHGWVYDIACGSLRDLGVTRGPESLNEEE